MSRFRSRVVVGVVLTAVLVVGSALQAGAAQPAAKSAPIDINAASQKALESLPGVGAATATKIIAGRPYASVADLAKAGVPAKTIEKITPLVTVGRTVSAPAAAPPAAAKPARSAAGRAAAVTAAGSTSPIDINAASQKDLEALPGVGPATATKIVAGRPYASVADLAKAGVPAKTIEKITPLVTVGRAVSAPAPKAQVASQPPASTAPPVSGASKAVPAPAPAAQAPAQAPASAAPPVTGTAKAAAPTAQVPPAAGMVWVNLSTKVYHYEGDQWYGKTKNGKFMTEQDAIAAGYRASKEKTKKTQ